MGRSKGKRRPSILRNRPRSLAALKGLIFKRGGHPDYVRQSQLLEFLFETEFAEWHENSCARIREATDLTKSIIYRWRKQWILDRKWRPWDLSVHGRHHQTFNQDEEIGIKEYIIANYLIPEKIFSDQMFREIAIKAFLAKYEGEENVPEFNCSDGFVSDFKWRNRSNKTAAGSHCFRKDRTM
jgi:hypothetical protein